MQCLFCSGVMSILFCLSDFRGLEHNEKGTHLEVEQRKYKQSLGVIKFAVYMIVHMLV